jgi:hypothetical protein
LAGVWGLRVTSLATVRIAGRVIETRTHHQTGVAPNEIELHPLLKFSCLSA